MNRPLVHRLSPPMVKDEPKTEDYMALITAQETQIASLKAEIESLKASKGDLAEFGEEMKKTFEDWSTKFSELSERVLGIEGKIGQPAGSGKSRGQFADPAFR